MIKNIRREILVLIKNCKFDVRQKSKWVKTKKKKSKETFKVALQVAINSRGVYYWYWLKQSARTTLLIGEKAFTNSILLTKHLY